MSDNLPAIRAHLIDSERVDPMADYHTALELLARLERADADAAALIRYARHRTGCLRLYTDEAECDCGLVEAIQAHQARTGGS
jgi:hypothetical protein